MRYEKPHIVDLSRKSEKGFGYACDNGSGAFAGCYTGPTAETACDGGSTFFVGPVKYED
jgi:hypothetical protein